MFQSKNTQNKVLIYLSYLTHEYFAVSLIFFKCRIAFNNIMKLLA